MGLFFIICAYNIQKSSVSSTGLTENKKKYRKAMLWVLLLVLVWDIFATFRYYNIWGVGGTDTRYYVLYFETCLSEDIITVYHHHLDIGYKAIFKSFRFFTADYHFLFLFLYGFISASFICFIREFIPKKTNFSPYILVIYAYVVAFSSQRSSFGIAIILFSLILLHREKTTLAILLAFSSVFIHKGCAIYVMATFFYLFFKNRKMTFMYLAIFMVITIYIGATLRDLFIQFASDYDLHGGYGGYASRSIDSSFWDNAYKIAIEQLLLLVCVFWGRGKFYKHLESVDEDERSKLNMIWILTVYDLVLIPVNFSIGNWRSPDFLYMVRVVMWGEMLWLFIRNLHKNIQWIASILCCTLFILRMWIQFKNSADTGGLMPYIFEPLSGLFK
ncbi:MAG: EpsG family protein [Prevotella sp.]|nr:EpsG family protein [Prevotella sp.]